MKPVVEIKSFYIGRKGWEILANSDVKLFTSYNDEGTKIPLKEIDKIIKGLKQAKKYAKESRTF